MQPVYRIMDKTFVEERIKQMRHLMFFLFSFLLFMPGVQLAQCSAWECNGKNTMFTHVPSQYYGSGQYFSVCPDKNEQIRCYHYHRHWICEKNEIYYWDRNLESAARAACGCNSPVDVEPSAPAISKKPKTRFHESDFEKD